MFLKPRTLSPRIVNLDLALQPWHTKYVRMPLVLDHSRSISTSVPLCHIVINPAAEL